MVLKYFLHKDIINPNFNIISYLALLYVSDVFWRARYFPNNMLIEFNIGYSCKYVSKYSIARSA